MRVLFSNVKDKILLEKSAGRERRRWLEIRHNQVLQARRGSLCGVHDGCKLCSSFSFSDSFLYSLLEVLSLPTSVRQKSCVSSSRHTYRHSCCASDGDVCCSMLSSTYHQIAARMSSLRCQRLYKVDVFAKTTAACSLYSSISNRCRSCHALFG